MLWKCQIFHSIWGWVCTFKAVRWRSQGFPEKKKKSECCHRITQSDQLVVVFTTCSEFLLWWLVLHKQEKHSSKLVAESRSLIGPLLYAACSKQDSHTCVVQTQKTSIFFSQSFSLRLWNFKEEQKVDPVTLPHKLSLCLDISLSHLIINLSRPPNDPSSFALPHCLPFIRPSFTPISELTPPLWCRPKVCNLGFSGSLRGPSHLSVASTPSTWKKTS